MTETHPRRVFISYSHKDDEHREKLVIALSQLQRDGLIERWDDRRISGGSEWAGQIDANLNAADIIILLVSPDFLASRYCYDVEMRRALERHDKHEARVVPIILRPCDWKTSPFAKLNALPKDGKPVVDWRTFDHAFLNVAEGLRAITRELGAGAERIEDRSVAVAARKAAESTRSRSRRLILFAVAGLVVIGLIGWLWSFEHQRKEQVRTLILQGNDLLNVGHYEDARKPFQEALGVDPGNAQATLGIGIADLVSSQFNEVAYQQKLAEMLTQWPNDPHLRVLNGDNLVGQGDREKAVVEYNKAIHLNPGIAEAYFRLGVIYDQEGQLGHALDMYQKAVNRSPYSSQYRDNLADAYFKHGEYDKAITEYGRIDRFPLAALESGQIQRILGRLDEAREEELRAIEWLSNKEVASLLENKLPWYFMHKTERVSIPGDDEKVCYAKFELSATLYLQRDEGQSAENAKQALSACVFRASHVKTAVRWELERVANENDALRARAEEYCRRFLAE